jgi:hypothetical protein
MPYASRGNNRIEWMDGWMSGWMDGQMDRQTPVAENNLICPAHSLSLYQLSYLDALKC